MPLIKSSKPSAISKNIREFRTGKTFAETAKKFGKEHADKQAVAVALSTARKARARADGGMVPYAPLGQTPLTAFLGGMGANQIPATENAPNLSLGVAGAPSMPIPGMPNPMQMGASPPSMMPRTMKRGGALGSGDKLATKHVSNHITRGPILSDVPGRTDAHATHVPSGSYVIPADIVSGRGEGNTLAGAKALQQMFKMTSDVKTSNSTAFRAPKLEVRSGGGKGGDTNTGKPVRVNLAGGEIVVPPENLMRVVHRDLKHAHALMDAWILEERKKLRKTLAKLPGPARD